MAAHGLHHRMAVRPGGEPRPYADDHRRVGDARTQIPLGEDGVHHRVGVQRLAARTIRVCQHRDDPLRQQHLRLRRVRRPHRRYVLHHRFPKHDGL